MTIREIAKKFNLRIRDEKFLKLGRYVYQEVYRQHLREPFWRFEQIKEGEYMVNYYPEKYTEAIGEAMLRFINDNPKYKQKRKRFKRIKL